MSVGLGRCGAGWRGEVVEHLLEDGAGGVGFAAGDGGAGVPEDGDHVAADSGVGDGIGPADDGGLFSLRADCIFADVSRDVVLMAEGVEIVEELIQFFTVIRGSPSHFHLAPGGVFGHADIQGVVVDGEEESVGGRVVRDVEVGAGGFDEVGVVAGDDEEAMRVVAAGAADGVDEELIDVVEGVVGFLRGARAIEVGFFVERFEDQPFASGREVAGDLGPVGAEFGFRVGAEGVVGGHKFLLVVGVDPAAVPVDVEDAEHVGVGDPVDDLGDALQFVGLDLAVFGIGVPGSRRRTDLKPRRARDWMYSRVMRGLPQPVSQAAVFSRVLPMLMPGVMRGTAAWAERSVGFSGVAAEAVVGRRRGG